MYDVIGAIVAAFVVLALFLIGPAIVTALFYCFNDAIGAALNVPAIADAPFLAVFGLFTLFSFIFSLLK